MTTIRLVTASREHVAMLAPRVRAADAAEALASGGHTPEQALRASLAASEHARTLFMDGEAACMYGVGPGDTSDAFHVVWMLTADVVDRHPFLFWRMSKRVVAELLSLYPVMVQRIDARYTRAVEWARRLGFKVWPAEPFGPQGLLFHRVSLGVM